MVAGGLVGLGAPWAMAGAEVSYGLGAAHALVLGGSSAIIGNTVDQSISKGVEKLDVNEQLISGEIGMAVGVVTGGTNAALLRARAFFNAARASTQKHIWDVAEEVTRGWEQNLRASQRLLQSGATSTYGQNANALYNAWMDPFQATYRQGLAEAGVAVNPAATESAYRWMTGLLYPSVQASAAATLSQSERYREKDTERR